VLDTAAPELLAAVEAGTARVSADVAELGALEALARDREAGGAGVHVLPWEPRRGLHFTTGDGHEMARAPTCWRFRFHPVLQERDMKGRELVGPARFELATS